MKRQNPNPQTPNPSENQDWGVPKPVFFTFVNYHPRLTKIDDKGVVSSVKWNAIEDDYYTEAEIVAALR